MLAATVELEGVPAAGRLTNVSATGALVIGPKLAAGTSILFRRGAIHLPARVAWAADVSSGIHFDQALDVGQVLRNIANPKAKQKPQDRPTRPGLKSAPLSRGQIALLERWGTAGKFVLGE